MTHPAVNALLLVVTAAVAFAISLAVRRRFTSLGAVDPSPWSSTLSYVATAYGVIVGFSILFLFGQFASARSAVGDEATSIGTAFEEAALFPDSAQGIQQSLICYSRSVAQDDWPAMRDSGSSPVVDARFSDLVASLGEGDQPTQGALHSAAATNLVAQVGNISTAREARLVAAESQLPPMLWALLIGGALFVIALIFVVTLPAEPKTQAALVAMSAMFTVIMIVIVFALATPFAAGSGRVNPDLIEQTTVSMEQSLSTPVDCPPA